MAPATLATFPTSDNSLLLPPVFQVTVLFSIVSLVLQYIGLRVSFTGTAQSQATLPVDVKLQADAPGSVLVCRLRFWWLSALFRRLQLTSRDAWLDFIVTLMVLGRGTSVKFLPLPVSSRCASSFSVSKIICKLFGQRCRAMGHILSVVVVGSEAPHPGFLYVSAWAPCGVVLPVIQANTKFALTDINHQTYPCPQTSRLSLLPPTTTFDYTFPCDPPGITPSGVG